MAFSNPSEGLRKIMMRLCVLHWATVTLRIIPCAFGSLTKWLRWIFKGLTTSGFFYSFSKQIDSNLSVVFLNASLSFREILVFYILQFFGALSIPQWCLILQKIRLQAISVLIVCTYLYSSHSVHAVSLPPVSSVGHVNRRLHHSFFAPTILSSEVFFAANSLSFSPDVFPLSVQTTHPLSLVIPSHVFPALLATPCQPTALHLLAWDTHALPYRRRSCLAFLSLSLSLSSSC